MRTSSALARCATILPCLFGCTGIPPIHSLDNLAASGDDESTLRAPASSVPRVFLLRGLWDVFSLGLDDLAHELNAQGLPATSISGPDWYPLAQRLQADYTNGEIRPLVLVGHSYGADDAVALARYLADQGVPVALLALVDATNPPAIPSNVDRCMQWFIPMQLADLAPHDFAGNPVIAAPGNEHTIIENLVFSAGLSPRTHGANHFNIEEHAYLHELVIAEIQSLVSQGASAAPAAQD